MRHKIFGQQAIPGGFDPPFFWLEIIEYLQRLPDKGSRGVQVAKTNGFGLGEFGAGGQAVMIWKYLGGYSQYLQSKMLPRT